MSHYRCCLALALAAMLFQGASLQAQDNPAPPTAGAAEPAPASETQSQPAAQTAPSSPASAAQPMPAPPPAAVAQPLPNPAPPPSSDKDQASFVDARLTRVKTALKLTPEQQPLWGPVESVIRATMARRIQRGAELRAARRDSPGAKEAADPIARMRERADYMSMRGEDLRELARVSEPLYQSLDSSQKRRFAGLLRAEDGPVTRRQNNRAGPAAARSNPRNREERSLFERLRNDVRRGWGELWD